MLLLKSLSCRNPTNSLWEAVVIELVPVSASESATELLSLHFLVQRTHNFYLTRFTKVEAILHTYSCQHTRRQYVRCYTHLS